MEDTKKPKRRAKKTEKAVAFIDGIVAAVVNCPTYRLDVSGMSEQDIQREMRQPLMDYLKSRGVDAGKDLYWEGQEGGYGGEKYKLFTGKNHPDFIINRPYSIAVEYKQGEFGAKVKELIGQSVAHTHSGEFDFVLSIFRDATKKGLICQSKLGENEKDLIDWLEERNVFLRFVGRADKAGS